MPVIRFANFFITTAIVLSCNDEKRGSRTRPSDETETQPHYLDSIEKDVTTTEESEISIGSTTVSIQKGSANSAYRVRISRLGSTPELSAAESLVLGDPKSDVVDVELYDPATSKTLASTDLLTPYELKQLFKSSEPTNNVGLMVITDKGTSTEQRVLLPNSELKITHATVLGVMELSEVTVRVNLKLTNATLWLVSYTDSALKDLTISTAEAAASTGGAETLTPILTTTSSITGASLSINSDSAYATTDTVTLDMSAAGASEMYVTNTSGCNEGGSWESFTTTKPWNLSALNSVARVYVKFRAADGSSSNCISDSITHDSVPPTPPTSILDGVTSSSLTASPSISWTPSQDSDLSYYEMAIGSTVGGDDIKSWTNIGNVTSFSVSGLTLTDGVTYYASVRARDLAALVSPIAESDGWTIAVSSLSCPTNYVKIPANIQLDTNEFCVMKYEAKNVGGVATSQAELTPWNSFPRGNDATAVGSAWKTCKDIPGGGYDLLTNAQWQAIARNIEGVASNWSDGVVGSNVNDGNSLNRGHSDATPNMACDGAIENVGTDCTLPDNSAPAQKRTHTLSDGSVIWDIAGNVWEWVQENYNSQGPNDFASQLTSANHILLRWGPAGNYILKNDGVRGGFGFSGLNFSSGTVLRGGGWNNDFGTGVFAATLDSEQMSTSPTTVGFRCTYSQ